MINQEDFVSSIIINGVVRYPAIEARMAKNKIKELPINFRSKEVKALLDGRKTMTRRVINKLYGFGKITEFKKTDTHGYDWCFRDKEMRWHDISHARLFGLCPYGTIGDRLWVRETFSHAFGIYSNKGIEEFRYLVCDDRSYSSNFICVPYSPIHMPRRASRITLEITNIRVERLQDIGDGEIFYEGVQCPIGYLDYDDTTQMARDGFKELWESIKGKGSWDLNPWVWVIEFKKL